MKDFIILNLLVTTKSIGADDRADDCELSLFYSFQHSFKSFLERTEELATIKDIMIEKMSTSVVKEMHKISSEAKAERKRSLQKLSEGRSQLDQQFKSLISAKKRYDQASEESHHALKIYEAAEQSIDQVNCL